MGLKENVIVGHRIPAGTGMREYESILVSTNENGDLLTQEQELNF